MNLAHLPTGSASPLNTETTVTLSAALAYAARGWPVLPVWWPSTVDTVNAAPACACGGASGCRPAKHPIGPLAPRGLRDATTDPRTLRAWWSAYPRANLALVTGASAGMFALDVDPTHRGDQTLIDLVCRHGAIGDTLRATTGSGGDHYFFRWPGRPVTSSAHQLGPGLDVRGAGGYVVAAPSLHMAGGRYAWGRTAATLLDAPPWLLALLAPAPPAPPAPTTPRSSPTTTPRSTPGGGDVRARAVAYLARMPPAISGHGGHAATLAAALALVRGFSLPPTVALEILIAHYNPRCEPPWSRPELEHKITTAARSERVGHGYLLAAKGAA